MSKSPNVIKQMSDVLKQGATLTELACPACASPLFRFKSGELRCVKCDKRVVMVREGENAEKMESQVKLSSLENTILEKIRAVEERIRNEEDPEGLQKLNAVLESFLTNLEKLRKIKS